jgi:WD40 repeat protein
MNAERDATFDDEFSARLEAYDEALAQGEASTPPGGDASPELRARLERGRNCLELLQQLRPRSLSRQPDTSIIAGGISPAAVPPRAEEKPLGVEKIGRFEIRRTLGSGGFGVVYLAHDPVLCRDVALKIPRAAVLADADWLTRFQREARAAAALNHPNLVQVYEAGQLGPVYYITLAYCPGHNLAQWLKLQTAPVPSGDAARLLATLARAIHYAHERGVLHRDLKPANVLLSTEAKVLSPEAQYALDVFIPKITDFGLAKLLEPGEHGIGDQTEGGAVLGTPCYMAPEQAEGRLHEVSPATDVYALGTILYEVITSRPPFWGDTPMAVFWQVKTSEPLPPGRLRVNLPRDLETICLKCLQKEPRRRYASAAALADDLDRFLAHRPIQARPISRLERVTKWVRRHRALAAMLAALALVTVLGVGGIFRQWLHTQDALADKAVALEKNEVSLYHQRVVLAHHEWLAGDVGRASQLLDRCRLDDQAWEWRYVRHLCDSDLLRLSGHAASVAKVAFSPDGSRLATVEGQFGSDKPGEVKLWDAATGKLLWAGVGHTGAVMALAFRPDGRHLASTSVTWNTRGGEIKIWEVATGKALQTFSRPPSGSFCVAYSPDGRLLVSRGAGNNLLVWDLTADKRLAVLGGHGDTIFDVAFSPDGRLLASACRDTKARVWNVPALWARATRESAASFKSLQLPVQVLSGAVDLRSVAFSPDSKRLLAGSYGKFVKMWDLADGRLLGTYSGHKAPVLDARFTPDGRWVASSDTGGTVHVWDPSVGRLQRMIRGHTGSVPCVAFSPGGRRLATAGQDRVARVWDFTREQESIDLVQAPGKYPDNAMGSVVFSPDGKLLAAAAFRRASGWGCPEVRIWPVDNWTRPLSWEGHGEWVSCVAFSPDGKLLASGSGDKSVRLWDVATGKTVHRLTGHLQPVTGVSFSPDGRRLVSSSQDRIVRHWDVVSGKLLSELPHPYPIQDVVYSSKGRVIAVGEQGMAKVWDPEAETELFTLKGHQQTIDRVVVSPDGRLLATASQDQTICLWELTAEPPRGGELLARRSLVGPLNTLRISGLAFSADSRRLAASGFDQTVRLWDVTSGDETLTLRGHRDLVAGVAFSPDGRWLASASTVGIKIWPTMRSPSPSAPVGPGEAEAMAWHRQQAQECAAAKPPAWFGVAFHVSKLIEAGPADGGLYRWRAGARAELKDWPGVLEDATLAIGRGATDPWTWYLQAFSRLQQGDISGYRQSCAELLKRFGQTDQPEQANLVAWTCALAPAAVADLDRAIRLVSQAARTERAPNTSYRNTLAAVLYRANQLDAARAILQQAIWLPRGGGPEDWLLLAMIHHQQGDKTGARAWLDKVARWRDAVRHSHLPEEQAPSQLRLSEIDLLRREAEALLAGR